MQMQLDELKLLARAGQFGAITLDTSIFDAHGLKLESGLIKQLEQFKDDSTKLIISEIVQEELLSHLTEKTKEVKKNIEDSLWKAKEYWKFDSKEIKKIEKSLFDGYEVEEFVSERFDEFIENTSLEVIKAQDYLLVEDLIQKYFRAEPPFAETGKKKNEFPDAIALMSLESWANKSGTKIIVVTRDNDWKNFCENSEYLYCTADLAGALGIFQLKDADDICEYLSEKYKKGTLENLETAVSNALDSQIGYLNIYPEANSAFVSEGEIEEIRVDGFEFNSVDDTDVIFRPVKFDSDSLTVESKLIVNVNIECNFSFSVYDSIDKDYVVMAANSLDSQTDLEVRVLIKFIGDLSKVATEIEIDNVEVEIKKAISIDFGDIEPDWGNEENYEY